MKFEKDTILEVMPQQPPFLFLDNARIEGDEAWGQYKITGEEECLQGHFKNNPVFPGSLILEALGQLAVFYVFRSGRTEFQDVEDGTNVYFVSCDGVKAQRVTRKGDVLDLHIKISRARLPLAFFSGEVKCDGENTASAKRLTFAVGDPF